MEYLWAPWRMQYIQMEKPEKCILCEKPRESNDVANYILYRGAENFIILNSYPYNPGHLMVAPYRHLSAPEQLTEAERSEHFTLVIRCVEVLRAQFSPGGFNIGINVGAVAGTGIEDHVHTHIIPRWNGDTNFVTVLSDVRVIPEALADTYQKLAGKF
ncbi:HIT domain-containing protein [Chloroflexota bacterium]